MGCASGTSKGHAKTTPWVLYGVEANREAKNRNAQRVCADHLGKVARNEERGPSNQGHHIDPLVQPQPACFLPLPRCASARRWICWLEVVRCDGECTNADRAVSRELEAATAGHRPRQRRFRPSIKNRETGNPQPNDVRINLGGRMRGSAPQHAEASRKFSTGHHQPFSPQ